jgi:hypothetical protein
VTVRGNDKSISGKPELDGVRTTIGTFQKAHTVGALLEEARRHFRDARILYGTDKAASITAILTGPHENADEIRTEERFVLAFFAASLAACLSPWMTLTKTIRSSASFEEAEWPRCFLASSVS